MHGFRSRKAVSAARALAAAVLLLTLASAEGESLRGSRASLDLQNRIAQEHALPYLKTPAEVEECVVQGDLIPLEGDDHYTLHGVSFPYARPAVRTFVQRLAVQYHDACGEPLVVTSLTRPRSSQPRNASPRSVHPTGMALDLRRPARRTCRSWLEGVLLALERRGVLEATTELRPPHYHVAVFPEPYERYAATMGPEAEPLTHRVARGESLWSIAQRYRTTVATIRSANLLRSSTIFPGQLLFVPPGR